MTNYLISSIWEHTPKAETAFYRHRFFHYGQILVTEDMLGLSGFYPKFVKKYGNLEKLIEKYVQEYKKDVITNRFPKVSNSY